MRYHQNWQSDPWNRPGFMHYFRSLNFKWFGERLGARCPVGDIKTTDLSAVLLVCALWALREVSSVSALLHVSDALPSLAP